MCDVPRTIDFAQSFLGKKEQRELASISFLSFECADGTAFFWLLMVAWEVWCESYRAKQASKLVFPELHF